MGVCAGRVYVGNEGLEDDSELVESQQVGHLLTRTENSPGWLSSRAKEHELIVGLHFLLGWHGSSYLTSPHLGLFFCKTGTILPPQRVVTRPKG